MGNAALVCLLFLLFSTNESKADDGSGSKNLERESPPPHLAIQRGDVVLGVERLIPLLTWTDVPDTSRSEVLLDRLPAPNPTVTGSLGRVSSPISAHDLVRVAIDVAVTDRLTVGAAPIFTWKTNDKSGYTSLALGLAPRVGYVFRPASRITFWPKLGLTYLFSNATVMVAPAPPASDSNISTTLSTHQLAVGLEAPLVITLVEHAGLSLGPVLEGPLVTNAPWITAFDLRTVHIGLYGGLVGWF